MEEDDVEDVRVKRGAGGTPGGIGEFLSRKIAEATGSAPYVRFR